MPGDTIIFHLSTTNDDMHHSLDFERDRQKIPENQILKKMKKTLGDTAILHTSTINEGQ